MHPCRRTVVILFNPKLVGKRKFITFLMGNSPKVNVTARLKFKSPYFETAVQQVNHYAMETAVNLKVKSQFRIFGACRLLLHCH